MEPFLNMPLKKGWMNWLVSSCCYLFLLPAEDSPYPDFAVSDAFMILVQRPTAASAVSEVEDASEVESYLVEPLRATSVVNKFTGTFGASQDTDKLTFTILAFHHFIMHETACLLAFADIQGEFFLLCVHSPMLKYF
jgi:hypothetical protein